VTEDFSISLETLIHHDNIIVCQILLDVVERKDFIIILKNN
jgi:hypothetical protein